MSSAATNPQERDPATAPGIADALPGDQFQFVLAAFKVAKDGRFQLKPVSQMLALYFRDVDDIVMKLGWEGIIDAEGKPLARTGWYTFTPFGLLVAKHVRKIHAKRNGQPDPDEKPSIFRRLRSWMFATTASIVRSVFIAVLTAVALALIFLWFKNKGIDLRGGK